MNTAQQSRYTSGSNFNTILNTAISYRYLDTLIWECNDIMLNERANIKNGIVINEWINIEKIKVAIQCKIKLTRLISGMRSLEEICDEGFTDEDIEQFNTEYRAIYEFMEYLREKPELIQEVQDQVKQITLEQRQWNIYPFPRIESSSVQLSDDIDTSHEKTTDINSAQSKMAAPHIRKQILQRELFGKNWEILSDSIIAKKRQKMMQTLGDDPVSAYIYKWDCLAANDEKFPENELSDNMISQAIRSAKMRKDGAYIQSIKNNLIKNAANDAIFDPNLETSGLLADHMKNLSASNPIILQTIEHGSIKITSSKTIEHGDATYYSAIVNFPNGTTKHLMLSANAFTVGDLSDKIIGEIDKNWKLIINNAPCTIRRIRSSIITKTTNTTNSPDRTKWVIYNWLQKLKNLFRFWKTK